MTKHLLKLLAFVFSQLLILASSCNQPQPSIKIGLSLNLSGRGGEASEEIRDGALLAFEDINRLGGINGRRLDLLVRDDQNTDDGIAEADSSLMEEGVIAIIGHSTSSNTLKAYPLVTKGQTLLITAYTATTKLSGIDDFFIRTSVDCDLYGRKTAKLLKKIRSSTVTFLMDMSNEAFVLDYLHHLRSGFSGTIHEVRFFSRSRVNWSRIIQELLAHQPDTIVFLSEASMTGVALQKLALAGYQGERVATLWAQTPSLIRYAGKSAEGLRIVTFINPDNSRPEFQQFSRKLQQQFHKKATARSARSYELVMILADALKRCSTIDPLALKASLLSGTYETLLGTVRFDRYGDVIRPVYEIVVHDQQFHNNGEL